MRIPRRAFTRSNPRQKHRDSYGRLIGTRDSPRQTRSRAPPGGGPPPKTPLPPLGSPQGPKRPQEAPRESSGTIRTHTGPYGSIRIHTDPSQINFQQIFCHFLTNFGKVCQKNVKGQSRHLASKEVSGAFASCRARKVSMDEPIFSPNAMRNCLIINRNV